MTKQFKPTYLCIKTHSVTGLKYFCKTTKSNYHGYAGSGTYWSRHLKIHGRKYTTELIGYYTDMEECKQVALAFSVENNIVEAVDKNNKKIWANMINENGLDGGATWFGPRPQEMIDRIAAKNKGKKRSAEVREKNRQSSLKGRKRKKGEFAHTEKAKEKIRVARAKQVITPESREKAAEKLRGRTKETHSGLAATAEKNRGRKFSTEQRANMSKGRKLYWEKQGPMPDAQRAKIREARKNQIFTDETKKKLSGKVVVVGKDGVLTKITKEQYLSQVGPKNEWEWVAHRSKEATMRR